MSLGCPSAGWEHTQPSAWCPRQLGLHREWEQTPGKGSGGDTGDFPDLSEGCYQQTEGPKDSQSFWEQQKPALVVQSDPAQEFPLCLCCDGEQTLYRSTRVRALLVPLISKQGRFSGFTAPPTPKWASGGPGVLHTPESHS